MAEIQKTQTYPAKLTVIFETLQHLTRMQSLDNNIILILNSDFRIGVLFWFSLNQPLYWLCL